jgi:hypothetical protein
MPSAPITRLSRASHGGVRFRSEYQAPVAELRELAHDDCRFRALLRFARVPYFTPLRGSVRYAGDLRYDRAPDLDFSDITLPASPRAGDCPAFVPDWTPPRAELLSR